MFLEEDYLRKQTEEVPVLCAGTEALKQWKADDRRFLLLLLYQGKAYWRTGRGKLEVAAPCILCFDEKSVPSLVDREKFECDVLRFEPEYVDEKLNSTWLHSAAYKKFAKKYGVLSFAHFTNSKKRVYKTSCSRMKYVRNCFQKLKKILDESSQQENRACGEKEALLELLFAAESACKATEYEKECMQNRHFAPALSYLECHYREDVLLEQLTEIGAASKPSLVKYFKKEMQSTPIAYLWKYRVQAASTFMLFSNCSMEEIAAHCGFKTMPHFSRKVKWAVGISPAKLRQSLIAAYINCFS